MLPVLCTFDIIHQFLVPTIWNPSVAEFIPRQLLPIYTKKSRPILLLLRLLSPKKCQMKFFCLMDSCHWNFLSNLRLKWGTKNGKRIFQIRQDKISNIWANGFFHYFFVSVCPGAKQPITYLSILLEVQLLRTMPYNLEALLNSKNSKNSFLFKHFLSQ